MKKNNKIKKALLYALGACFMFVACNTDTEPVDFDRVHIDMPTTRTPEYYAALREWKATPGLPQIFCWFDAWSGVSPAGRNSLRGLPDSVTLVGSWGPKFDLNEAQRADMEYVQRVKGTRVLVTIIAGTLGDGMPNHEEDWAPLVAEVGNSSDPAVYEPAIRKYVEALHDGCVEYGYDGFDWDYEPQYSGTSAPRNPLWHNQRQSDFFVKELMFWFGKSASDPTIDRGDRRPAHPGLLLVIDGEIGLGRRMPSNWHSYNFDYYILQAYGSSDPTSRVTNAINDVKPWIDAGIVTVEEIASRVIVTDNFESYADTGGAVLNQSRFIYRNNNWNGQQLDQQIGGFGIFRVGFDYPARAGRSHDGHEEYYFFRRGITNLYNNYRRIQAEKEEKEEVEE